MEMTVQLSGYGENFIQGNRITEDRYIVVDRGHGTPCWEWRGALNNGYGWLSIDGVSQYAHRRSFVENVGPVPDGLTIDHLCKNRKCVNPTHMEPVTLGQNTRRRFPSYVGNDDMSKCIRGHDLTPGLNYCRTCAFGDGARPYRGPQRDLTHCPHGHEYSGTNLIFNKNGHRVCRKCKAADHQRRRSKRRQGGGTSL